MPSSSSSAGAAAEKQSLLGNSNTINHNASEYGTDSDTQQQQRGAEGAPAAHRKASTMSAVSTASFVAGGGGDKSAAAAVAAAPVDSTRSRNVILMMLYNFIDGAAFSVWQSQVLQVLLYNVAGESNTVVGLASGAGGLAQVISAAAAGYAGDVLVKKYLTRCAAVVGCIAAVTTLYAVYSRSLVMYFTSSAFWGFYSGYANPSSEALFADSISSGKRTAIYTKKYVIQILCYLVGYAVNIGLFFRLGDEWDDDTLETVMYIGVACHPIAFIPLALLSDRFNLKNMLARATAKAATAADDDAHASSAVNSKATFVPIPSSKRGDAKSTIADGSADAAAVSGAADGNPSQLSRREVQVANLQSAVDTFYETVVKHEQNQTMPAATRDPTLMLMGGGGGGGGGGEYYPSTLSAATEQTRETVIAGAALEAADLINNATASNNNVSFGLGGGGGNSMRNKRSNSNTNTNSPAVSKRNHPENDGDQQRIGGGASARSHHNSFEDGTYAGGGDSSDGGGGNSRRTAAVTGSTILEAVLAIGNREGGGGGEASADTTNNNNATGLPAPLLRSTRSASVKGGGADVWQSTRAAALSVFEPNSDDDDADDATNQQHQSQRNFLIGGATAQSARNTSNGVVIVGDENGATPDNNGDDVDGDLAERKEVIDRIVKPKVTAAPIVNHTPLEKVEFYYRYRARVLRRRARQQQQQEEEGGAAATSASSRSAAPPHAVGGGGLIARTIGESIRGVFGSGGDNAASARRKREIAANSSSARQRKSKAEGQGNCGDEGINDDTRSDVTRGSRHTMATVNNIHGDDGGTTTTPHSQGYLAAASTDDVRDGAGDDSEEERQIAAIADAANATAAAMMASSSASGRAKAGGASSRKRSEKEGTGNRNKKHHHHHHHDHVDVHDAMSDVESLFGGDEDADGLFSSATKLDLANNNSNSGAGDIDSIAGTSTCTSTSPTSPLFGSDSTAPAFSSSAAAGGSGSSAPPAGGVSHRSARNANVPQDSTLNDPNAEELPTTPTTGGDGDGGRRKEKKKMPRAAIAAAAADYDGFSDEEAVYSKLDSRITLTEEEKTERRAHKRKLRAAAAADDNADYDASALNINGGSSAGDGSTGKDAKKKGCSTQKKKQMVIPKFLDSDSEDDLDDNDASIAAGYSSCLPCPAMPCHSTTMAWHENYNIVPYLVVSADFIQAVGSGMTVRFLTLFFVNDYDLKPIVITITFVMNTVISAIIAMVMSRLAVRLQRLPLILGVRFIGTTALALMAILPKIDEGNKDSFFHSIYLLLAIFITRQSCMNSSMGISRAVVMDFVRPDDRAKWSSMESFASFTWAGSAAVGGVIADAYGYGSTFLVTAGLHYFACCLLLPAAIAGRRLERIVLSMNAKDRAAKAEKEAKEKAEKEKETTAAAKKSN